MRQILLIEDRPERQKIFMEDRPELQKIFMEDKDVKIGNDTNILDNCTGTDFDKIKQDFTEDKFDLTKYSVIITHRSAFKGQILDKLKDYCETSEKKLVFFSGGISSTYYTKEPFEFLSINSKSFYSKNLESFLKEPSNILVLGYGNQWKTSLLLNILEKLNIFIDKNKDENEIDYDDLEIETEIDSILSLIEFDSEDFQKNPITIDKLNDLSQLISQSIEKEVTS